MRSARPARGPAVPRLPCAVGVDCGRLVSMRAGAGLRPVSRFRVGPRELPPGALICRAHEPVILLPYGCACGAELWGHPGLFYQHRSGSTMDAIHYMRADGARLVDCPACRRPLPRALPVGWEERRTP